MRKEGKTNDAQAHMVRDMGRLGVVARRQPPGRHEKRGGVEGENLLIGRVQFIALRTAHEVAIFDCWSKCGTRTVERSDGRAPLLSSRPGSRRVLLFAPGERFVLEVGETARVTFNPRAAAA